MAADQPHRRCTRCGVERPLAMFYLTMEARRRQREGRRVWVAPCRVCQREIDRRRRAPRQEYLDKIKVTRGCSDCGIKSDHPEIYDFDHRPGVEKVRPLALFMTSGTWEEMLAEIEKCDVVCANCHRIRTRAREHGAFGKSRSTTADLTPAEELLFSTADDDQLALFP